LALDADQGQGVPVILSEPALAADTFFGSTVVRDLAAFKAQCDVILANRQAADLADVTGKVFTRDVFGEG
jgi:UDPglucose 6-dehydrogenase